MAESEHKHKHKQTQTLPEEVLYDTRLARRHIERGLLSREALAKRIENLADLEAQADRIDLDQLAASGRGKRPGT